MSAVCGIFNLDGRPVAPEILGGMSTTSTPAPHAKPTPTSYCVARKQSPTRLNHIPMRNDLLLFKTVKLRSKPSPPPSNVLPDAILRRTLLIKPVNTFDVVVYGSGGNGQAPGCKVWTLNKLWYMWPTYMIYNHNQLF